MKRFIFTFIGLLLTAQFAQAATLSLSPAGGELVQGCEYKTSIIVDTQGDSSLAADAFLNYNPSEIEIIDQNPGLGGIQLGTGHTYEAYPGNQVSNGIIRLTGFNKSGSFSGRGVLATIKFKPKQNINAASIVFDFSPGRSTDSNVADLESKDVLSSVSNARFTFKKGSCERSAPKPKVIEEITPEVIEEIDETEMKLKECEETLKTLENFYKFEANEGKGEFLCPGESVLRPAAQERAQGNLLLFLLILLALSLLLNLDMLLRPENHIVSKIPIYNRPKKVKSHFKTKRVKRTRKKRK